ncbi:MAG: hypothetical protein JWN15_1820, partial [Firmicutes bacterium]|nr:hypothetical protein [Bacillota bacterium]
KAGDVLDAFVWGNGRAVPGWSGPAVSAGSAGTVFQRAVMEDSLGADSAGHFVTDGASAAAWRQGTDWLPRRMVRAAQSELAYPTFTVPGATAFTCPDSAFAVISQFIDKASRRLDINLYHFTQPELADRVIAAIGRKVSVRLLLEGEPFMGVPPNARETMVKLQAGGVPVQLLHRAADGFKRYRFDHAKYAVADGHLCLMMSDNWTNTSVPSSQLTGHRGWGLVLDSAALADHLSRVFAGDWNSASLDSVPFNPDTQHVLRTAPRLVTEPQRALPQPIAPVQIGTPLTVTAFFAPDHALLQSQAICGLIRSAATTLDVQQASLSLFWGHGAGASVAATPNLFLAEVVAAARRGVRVRVLMDGAFLNSQEPRDNSNTRQWVQSLGSAERLPLEARILDAKATGMSIHNKGLIIDGRKVLISSINWTENSPLENREMGLIVESEAAAAFYGAAFERDWAGGK